MSMPEAPVNKDSDRISCQHDIGLAGKTTNIQPETKALRVKARSDNAFWSSIATPNQGHVSTSLRFVRSLKDVTRFL
jgi:hypothetical protein